MACGALLSCGATARKEALLQFLAETPAREGRDWCMSRSVEQDISVKSKAYLEQTFRVHRWRQEPGFGDLALPERSVFHALENNRLGLVLLLAPAGHGKSRFAEAMEARLCGSMPILRLDVAGEFDLTLSTAKDDAVPLQLIRQLKVPAGDRQAEFRTLMAKARWVLVVENLHDVPAARRPRVIDALHTFVARYPRQVQIVVMTRPELRLTTDAMLPFDTVLEIAPLDCARTDLLAQIQLGAAASRLRPWLAAHGIDAPVSSDTQCSYRHLQTFRAVRAATDAAKAMGIDKGDGSTALRGLRSTAVEQFVLGLLKSDMAKVQATAVQGLEIAAWMAGAQPSAVLASDVVFKHEQCVAFARQARMQHPEETCRRLLDTALFTPIVGQGVWRLAAPPLDDLVRAKAVAGKLAAGGCAAVAAQALVVRHGQTAALLMGQAAAQACMAEVADALCVGSTPESVARQLSLGLPEGASRANLWARTAVPSPGCAEDALVRLGLPKPVRTPAPMPTGSTATTAP
jgi:hypothetical protein